MKSEGVVINSFDYKETSKIIHLYTIDGKMSVEAVGANNPKKGLLGFTEIGNTVSFITTYGKIKKVVEYEVLNSLYDISLDLLRVKCFMVILDIIKNILQTMLFWCDEEKDTKIIAIKPLLRVVYEMVDELII